MTLASGSLHPVTEIPDSPIVAPRGGPPSTTDRIRNALALVRALRLRFVRNLTIGAGAEIRGVLQLSILGTATIANAFGADGRHLPARISVGKTATLNIGDNLYMNSGATITAWHEIRIGNNVMMAPASTIMDDNRHEVEPGSPLSDGPTVIEDNVWLGRNVVVLPGVTIGAGSVIAANSVVAKNIPSSVLAGGSPAKVIRPLDIPAGWRRT